MTEHPRLNDLVRLADAAGYDAYRVFDGDARDRRGHQFAHELQGLGLFLPLVLEPTRTADGKMRAWRMCHEKIPMRPSEVIANIVLDVSAFTLGG
jgi:hypothetical protein